MKYVDRASAYRHFKGNYYYVTDLAENTETGETMVIYHDLYTDEGLTYVRPLEMFLSEVDDDINPTGQRYRFEKVGYTN